MCLRIRCGSTCPSECIQWPPLQPRREACIDDACSALVPLRMALCKVGVEADQLRCFAWSLNHVMKPTSERSLWPPVQHLSSRRRLLPEAFAQMVACGSRIRIDKPVVRV